MPGTILSWPFFLITALTDKTPKVASYHNLDSFPPTTNSLAL